MKIILQEDVKDLGKVGDVVNVKEGFARNYLFPKRLAVVATEDKVKEWQHLQKVAEVKKAKAKASRQGVLDKMEGLTLTFKAQAGEADKLFGSISQMDISKELDKQGFSVDRRDIYLEDAIKFLGQHKAVIKFSEDQKAELTISVEKV